MKNTLSKPVSVQNNDFFTVKKREHIYLVSVLLNVKHNY